MQGEVIAVLIIPAALIIVAGVVYLQASRSRELLMQWAEASGYRLLRAEHRAIRKGPFFWATKGQTVYRVEVCDERGVVRKGWVQCGHWLAGLFVDEVAVRWDEYMHTLSY